MKALVIVLVVCFGFVPGMALLLKVLEAPGAGFLTVLNLLSIPVYLLVVMIFSFMPKGLKGAPLLNVWLLLPLVLTAVAFVYPSRGAVSGDRVFGAVQAFLGSDSPESGLMVESWSARRAASGALSPSEAEALELIRQAQRSFYQQDGEGVPPLADLQARVDKAYQEASGGRVAASEVMSLMDESLPIEARWAGARLIEVDLLQSYALRYDSLPPLPKTDASLDPQTSKP